MEQQHAERTGVTWGNGGTDEYGYPDGIPTLFVDGGERYRLVPFAPEGVVEEPGIIVAHNGNLGIRISEWHQAGQLNGERVAWSLDGRTWERRGKYMVRTERRSDRTVAVYVKGPAAEGLSIDRAGDMYARRVLGASGGPVSSGVEFADVGATWIAQRIYVVQRDSV